MTVQPGAVVLSWLGKRERPSRIVLCTPSKSTEAWVLAAIWPEGNVVRRDDRECRPNPEGQIKALPRSRRFRKRPDDYQRRQREITQAWPEVSARLTEAVRFEAEFLAVAKGAGARPIVPSEFMDVQSEASDPPSGGSGCGGSAAPPCA